MTDFENNIFIKIEQRSPRRFRKIDAAKRSVQSLNTELQRLVSLASQLSGTRFDVGRFPTATKPADITQPDIGKTTKQFDEFTNAQNRSTASTEKGAEAQNQFAKNVANTNRELKSGTGVQNAQIRTLKEFGKRAQISSIATKNMADGTVQYISTVRKADGSLARFNATTGKHLGVTKNFDKLTSTLTQSIRAQSIEITRIIGKVLIWTAATTAVFSAIRFLSSSLKVFTEFEKETVALARVSRFGADDVAQMTSEVFQLSKALGSNVITTAQAAVSLSRLGLQASKASFALEAGLLAQNVAEISVEVATKRLIAAVNQFGKDMSEATDILDEWNELSNRNAVTVDDLARSVSIAGSVFSAYGASIEDLNALTTVLAENTAKSGNEIGNALKTIASFAFRPKTIKAIEELTGITVETETGDLKNLNLLLTEAAFKMDQLTEAERNNLVTSLAGARQRNFALIALNNFDEVLENVAEQFVAANSSIEENEKVLESFGGQVNQLKASLDEAKVALGETLADGLVAFIPKLKEFAQFLANSKVQMFLAVGAATALSAALATLLVALAGTPIGAAVVGLGLLGGAIAGSITESNTAIQQLNRNMQEGNKIADEFIKKLTLEIDLQKDRLNIVQLIEAAAKGLLLDLDGQVKSAEDLVKPMEKLDSILEGFRGRGLSVEDFEAITNSSDRLATISKIVAKEQENTKKTVEGEVGVMEERLKLLRAGLIQDKESILLAKQRLADFEEENAGYTTRLKVRKEIKVLQQEITDATEKEQQNRGEITKAQENLEEALKRAATRRAKEGAKELELTDEQIGKIDARAKKIAEFTVEQIRLGEKSRAAIANIGQESEVAKVVTRIKSIQTTIQNLTTELNNIAKEQGLKNTARKSRELEIRAKEVKKAISGIKLELRDFVKESFDLAVAQDQFKNFQKGLDKIIDEGRGKAFATFALQEEENKKRLKRQLEFLNAQKKELDIALQGINIENQRQVITNKIKQTEEEILQTRRNLFTESRNAHVDRIRQQRESLQNIKNEILGLEDSAEMLKGLQEIETIKNLKEISFQLFTDFSKQQKDILKAARPDLYEQVTGLPATGGELEKEIKAKELERANKLAEAETGFTAASLDFATKVPSAAEIMASAAINSKTASEIFSDSVSSFSEAVGLQGAGQAGVFFGGLSALLPVGDIANRVVTAFKSVADSFRQSQEEMAEGIEGVAAETQNNSRSGFLTDLQGILFGTQGEQGGG